MKGVIWVLVVLLLAWIPVVLDSVPEEVKEVWRPYARMKIREMDLNVTTPFYSLEDELRRGKSLNTSNTAVSSHFPNSQFSVSQLPPLSFDAATAFSDPSITCRPDSYGYSLTESESIFPYKGWPRCSSIWNQTYTEFHFSPKNHSLHLICKDKQAAEYLLGPIGPWNFPLQEELEPFLRVERMERDVELRGSEDYVVARCGGKGGFDIVATEPVYSERRHKEAVQAVAPNARPRIVMLLVLDSFSRRHFYQKLPRTVQYLASLQSSPYLVVDFTLHNVHGDGSVQNTIPVFSSVSGKSSDRYGDMLSSTSIWTTAKEQGYVSAVYFEGCDQMFPDEIGRTVHIDHLSRQFMCSVAGLGGYTSLKSSADQRCIGPHMAHVYGFEYTKQFLRMYEGGNRLVYQHYEAAHEASGLHAETIDEDLEGYLKDVMQEFGRENDIILFLMADHGMR